MQANTYRNMVPPGQRYVEEPQLLSRRGRGSSNDGLSPLPTYSPQVQHLSKKQPQRGQWDTPPVINYGVGGGSQNHGGSTIDPNEIAHLQANVARLERTGSSNRRLSDDGSSSRKPSYDDQVIPPLSLPSNILSTEYSLIYTLPIFHVAL